MKAYTDKVGDLYACCIQTPRGTWIRLDGYHRDFDKANEWLADCGFIVIDKHASYE